MSAGRRQSSGLASRSDLSDHRSTASARWYEGLPPASAEIDCGGGGHRITWHHGKLVLEDHDLLAERSLTALGAKPPLCLRIFDAWHEMRDSQIVCELLLGDSRRSPVLLAGEKATREARIKRTQETHPASRPRIANRPRRPPRPSRRERQDVKRQRERRLWATTLVNLPPALRTALALAVIVNFERHWHDVRFRGDHAGNIEPALTALASPLFEYSARRWSARFKPHARFLVQASLLAPGEPPRCDARAISDGAFGNLAVPISWFTDVWARDMALLDHSFVLGLAPGSGDDTELCVFALRWEHQNWRTARSVVTPALVTERGSGDWRLRWL